MNFVVRPLYNNANLLMILLFTAIVIASGILMRVAGNKRTETSHFEATGGEPNCSTLNATEAEPRKKPRRKEYLFRLLTNTTRSLIQMEIKARRLEENMRRIKERTVNLLWKNKDKALWRILFKNISKHIAIRHEFHQHSSLDRILHDRPAYRGREDYFVN